ncbi:MAG: protein kinase [Myxococcota bacterium]
MKCSSCGTVLADGAVTCQSCGTPVAGAPVAAMPSTQLGARAASAVSQRNLKPLSNREEKGVVPVRVGDVLLGRYRLEQKIGEGGMGTVYIAHDVELDRQVAVKLLAANLVTDDEVVERFEREARLNAKLDHPNIAPVYDVGRHEGRPFIVMKLLEGDTLAALLRTKGGFSSDETLKLMRQLAAGLDYIHGRGFIHRDIKAGNIFVSPTGHATILDFGILRPKSASEGLTRTGMVMGTPHYMAPEQALGMRDVDHRVDIYALAVVLFECLTGTLPFEADSELRLIQMQAHAPPPDILQRAPWIVKPVADVMRRALAKRPDDRFNSGAELVKALEAAYRDSGGHPAAPPQKVQEGTAPGWRMKAGLLSALREKDAASGGAGAPPVAGSSPPMGGQGATPAASSAQAGSLGSAHAGTVPGGAGYAGTAPGGATQAGAAPGEAAPGGVAHGGAHGRVAHGGAAPGEAAHGGAARGGATPGEAAHGGAAHSGAVPGGATQAGAAQGGAVPSGATQAGAAQGGAGHGGAAPGGAALGGAAHGGAAHGGAAHGGAAHGGAAHGGAAHGGAAHGGAAHGGAAPGAAAHGGAAPAGTSPDRAGPGAGASSPLAGPSSGAAPQPAPGAPEHPVPRSGIPARASDADLPATSGTARRGLITAGVVAALGVLAAFATWKLIPSSASGTVDAGVSTLARDAGTPALAVSLDAGAPVVATAPDASADAPDAGEAVALATPDAGPATLEDAGTRVAITPAGKKSGRLNVITTHAGEPWWAQVSIDGVPRGRTPILLDLPVGKYQLRVERAGFRTEQREIKVASGKSTVLRIDLIP